MKAEKEGSAARVRTLSVQNRNGLNSKEAIKRCKRSNRLCLGAATGPSAVEAWLPRLGRMLNAVACAQRHPPKGTLALGEGS